MQNKKMKHAIEFVSNHYKQLGCKVKVSGYIVTVTSPAGNSISLTVTYSGDAK